MFIPVDLFPQRSSGPSSWSLACPLHLRFLRREKRALGDPELSRDGGVLESRALHLYVMRALLREDASSQLPVVSGVASLSFVHLADIRDLHLRLFEAIVQSQKWFTPLVNFDVIPNAKASNSKLCHFPDRTEMTRLPGKKL